MTIFLQLEVNPCFLNQDGFEGITAFEEIRLFFQQKINSKKPLHDIVKY